MGVVARMEKETHEQTREPKTKPHTWYRWTEDGVTPWISGKWVESVIGEEGTATYFHGSGGDGIGIPTHSTCENQFRVA